MTTLLALFILVPGQPSHDKGLTHFESKVRPLLASKCLGCHSEASGKMKGGLDLSTAKGVARGGENGPVVIPGKPGESILLKAVRRQEGAPRMPPSGALNAEAVAALETWILQGAVFPASATAKGAANLWAAKPLARPEVPTPKDSEWSSSPIDRFTRAAQEAAGIHPVADAPPAQLLRRIHLDLTGLPPTAGEVDAFLRDPSEAAYRKVVDRLLASPRFGEKWGRHWLDVARFAESTGKQVNFNFPHAWRYRDWVIHSFNSDMPHADFVTRQLAGDLIPFKGESDRDANRVATGFLAVGPKALNERSGTQFAMDLADEQIDTSTQAFLGLTVACARCHDHKYDPVTQAEYTALAGIFRSTDTCYGTIRLVQAQHPSRLIALSAGAPAGREALDPLEVEAIKNRRDNLGKELESLRSADPGAAFASMRGIRLRIQQGIAQGQLELYHDNGDPKRLAMGARDRFFQVDVPVYERGEIAHPGKSVPRGLPRGLGGEPERIQKGSGRLELARWIAGHPLSARVAANRVWQHLMGRGLVQGGDNFGAAGPLPANPALLDWLAGDFLSGGGSTKHLIRTIVLSRTYRLGHEADANGMEKDPENATWWRHERRRLDAESLRDSILAVSGRIDLEPLSGTQLPFTGEGPAVSPRGNPGADVPSAKRSVYLPVMRDALPESMSLFDGADPSLIVPERRPTTTPAQGLFLLNNQEMERSGEALARRVLAMEGTDGDRISYLAKAIWNRPARPLEVEAAQAFLREFTLSRGGLPFRARIEAFGALAHAQMASADFLFIP